MPISPYVITFSPGSPNTGFTIDAGTVDSTSTTLVLPGYGKIAYGEWLVEDFVRMLENFASATPPTNPVIGQLWYDSSVDGIKVWDGSAYNELVTKTSGYDISISFPGNPANGDMIGGYVSTRSMTLPINFVGSFARVNVAPGVPYVLDVTKNGASVGTINFAAAATTGTFTIASPVSLIAGDVLRIVSTTTDGSFEDVLITLLATLD